MELTKTENDKFYNLPRQGTRLGDFRLLCLTQSHFPQYMNRSFRITVAFSITTENFELKHEYFPKHSRMGTKRMRQEIEEKGEYMLIKK